MLLMLLMLILGLRIEFLRVYRMAGCVGWVAQLVVPWVLLCHCHRHISAVGIILLLHEIVINSSRLQPVSLLNEHITRRRKTIVQVLIQIVEDDTFNLASAKLLLKSAHCLQ